MTVKGTTSKAMLALAIGAVITATPASGEGDADEQQKRQEQQQPHTISGTEQHRRLQQQSQQPQSQQQGAQGRRDGEQLMGEQPQARSDQEVDLKRLPQEFDMLFPLEPQERRDIRERQLQDQMATYEPLRDVTPVRDIERIQGDGSSIPTIYVTPDYPSAIVFTDMTGAQWPIEHIAQTDALARIEQPGNKVNSLVLHANNHAGQKSISIYLKGMTMPITVMVTGRDTEYHSLKHVQIQRQGPHSKGSLPDSGPRDPRAIQQAATEPQTQGGRSLDNVLNKLAYRVTPEGFQRLQTSDSNTDAWIDEDDASELYVLTDYSIVSPAPVRGSESVTALQNDQRLYVLPRIDPVVGLNEHGERIYLSFRERD